MSGKKTEITIPARVIDMQFFKACRLLGEFRNVYRLLYGFLQIQYMFWHLLLFFYYPARDKPVIIGFQ